MSPFSVMTLTPPNAYNVKICEHDENKKKNKIKEKKKKKNFHDNNKYYYFSVESIAFLFIIKISI